MGVWLPLVAERRSHTFALPDTFNAFARVYIMSIYTSTYQFQGVQGPTDPMLKNNAVEGYQPVSRIEKL